MSNLVFWADIARMFAIFALGLAISLEVTVVRYSHVAIYTPQGELYFVPLKAQVLRAISRVGAVMFIAVEIHERFGHGFSWRVPAALGIALFSAMSTVVTARNRLTGKVG